MNIVVSDEGTKILCQLTLDWTARVQLRRYIDVYRGENTAITTIRDTYISICLISAKLVMLHLQNGKLCYKYFKLTDKCSLYKKYCA